MLDDRDYMRRRPRYELQWSVTVLIVAINVLIFVLQNLVDYRSNYPYDHFALSVNGLKHGYIWQLITFQFLHLPLNRGGIFHLLGNLYAIWLLGPAVEEKIGRLGFIRVYLLSGTLGGLLQIIAGYFSPEHFGGMVVGASAGVFGVLAVFATFFPARHLHVFFLPFTIRADVLLTTAVAGTLAGLFFPSGNVAQCAHLGGIFMGFIFARNLAHARKTIGVLGLNGRTPLKIISTP